MDPSSPYAMARLVGLKDQFRVAFANEPDSDRHGIVTRFCGADEPEPLSCGGDPVSPRPSSSLASARRGRQDAGEQQLHRSCRRTAGASAFYEVPVGFKWFVPGLFDGSCCFGGEESAGASFLRHDGTVWTTDKDGPIMDLLAAEITARTGKDPGEHYHDLVAEFGASHYNACRCRCDARAEGASCSSCLRGGDDANARR